MPRMSAQIVAIIGSEIEDPRAVIGPREVGMTIKGLEILSKSCMLLSANSLE